MTPAERKLRTELMRWTGLRDRIELMLPARLFYTCAANILEHPQCEAQEIEFCRATMPVLAVASHDPVVGLDAVRQRAAIDIVNRLNRAILLPYEHRPRAVVYTMLTHWLNGLIADGLISDEFPPDLHAALNAFVEVMNQHPDLLEDVWASAAKNARRLTAQLRGLGLYQLPEGVAA